jgi:cell division protein FtsI/penicillin-binding protein 2
MVIALFLLRFSLILSISFVASFVEESLIFDYAVAYLEGSMNASYRRRKGWLQIDRISLLSWSMILLLTFIGLRLFQIQVIDFSEYSTYAEARLKGKVIPARRGRILLHDSENGYFELVNNVTLHVVFADPSLIDEASSVARDIAPLLYNSVKARYKSCGNDEGCLLRGIDETLLTEKRLAEQEAFEAVKLKDPTAVFNAPVHSEESLLKEFTDVLAGKIAKKERDFVILKLQVSTENLTAVQDLALTGVYTGDGYVWTNPLEVSEPRQTAAVLAPILSMPEEDLAFSLRKRANRYVRLVNKIDFLTVEKIKELGISGIGFDKEHWRHYSEQDANSFSSQVLGFLDHEGTAVYGLEKEWDDVLRGREGLISGQVDLLGRTLTARASRIEEAKNGSDIVLSLIHPVQDKIEELLEAQVKSSDARSGQVIVQDPNTGKVLAMASYPGFNPNQFGNVYEKREISLTQEEEDAIEVVNSRDGDRYFLYYNPGFKVELFKDGDTYKVYENRLGVGVYRNSAVSDIYEPGSTFKALIMASAIDAGEIKPTDTFKDEGSLDVDCHTLRYDEVVQGLPRKAGEYVCDYTINNSDRNAYGTVTMTQILEKSLNTGMAFISKKMGPSLMYDYLRKFGFGEKTYIELPDEEKGKMVHYRNWISESDLITKSFGQGIAVTPIQLVNAFSAVVNGGILLQPSVVDGVLTLNDEFSPFEPVVIRRVITEETSDVMKAMLVSSIERGVASPAKVSGYRIGGKTGTSQIATRGQYEKGAGSTYATFAGFGPFEDPRFVVLVKIDRPRNTPWGSTNAAPLFQKIMQYLLEYYQISPTSDF